jgi:hypothetical protein
MTRHSAPPTTPPGSLPAVSAGDIGGAGPSQLLSASTSGAWVALCQGEPKSASLVLGSGLGEPISDLYAQDPTGRHVVVRTPAGVVTLIDALTGTRVDLSALGVDVRRLRADHAPHRALSFSANGEQLAYVRKQGQETQVVVRQLMGGSERAFSVGAGDVFRLRLSADARFVSLDLLRDDTTKNGKLDWPTPEESAIAAPCSKPALPRFRSFAHQGRGDSISTAVRGCCGAAGSPPISRRSATCSGAIRRSWSACRAAQHLRCRPGFGLPRRRRPATSRPSSWAWCRRCR